MAVAGANNAEAPKQRDRRAVAPRPFPGGGHIRPEGRGRVCITTSHLLPRWEAGLLNSSALLGRCAVAALLFVAPLATGTDMTKTLRAAFSVAETGFDPQAAYDSYSFYVIGGIFDPLYVYDYFARPVRMVPNTAAALPEVTDQGRTYTIRVRPGIRFGADPAFKGKPRELVAEDYVYSLKRIFDPKVRSYWLYLFEGNLVGLDEPLAAARKSGTWDYDAVLAGLRTLDRYTLQIKFRRPNYGFEWWLASNQFSAVAREVVDAYKDASNRVMENPVGTGPYRLKQWTRGQRILLEANPDYRDVTYPAPAQGSEPGDAAIAKGLVGKKLPLVGNVDISIIEEAQPRLLSFDSGRLDYLALPATLSVNVLDGAALKREYSKRGITLHRQVSPSVSFFYFNLDHPLVGGYSPERLALRRAISMGYDRHVAISTLLHGQAVPAAQPVPPPLFGHDPKYVAPYGYDPRGARALLDRFGYKDRDGDGYRELPDGGPLTLVLASTPDNAARASDELWKRNMDAIGLRITFLKNKWPELNKMSEAGQLMMWGLAWISTVPDGSDYYSYFDSRNIGMSNDARMRLPAFDALYAKSRLLPHGPDRTRLFDEMTDMLYAYTPWIFTYYPYANDLVQPWLKGYKQHPFVQHQWRYYDVERRPQ
jgi:ABC-type transport system substrate-binding protein